MAAFVGKLAAKKMLAGQMKKYQSKDVAGPYDPLFALEPHPRKPGKFKKVKKQIPEWIPDNDAMILARVRKRAYRLDMALFNLFGIRFGWSSVIGIIPAAGDVLDLFMAVLLLQMCSKIEGGLPSGLQARMVLNIMIDFAMGLIPFIGDLADAAYKCNTKNCRLLEEHLDKKYRPAHLRKDGRGDAPATVYEDISDEEDERKAYTTPRDDREPRRPEPAVNRDGRLGDLERGQGGRQQHGYTKGRQ